MNTDWRTIAIVPAALLLAAAATADAQQRPDAIVDGRLPAAIAETVTGMLNDTRTDVRDGPLAIGAGARHDGDLAVVNGDLTLGGSVEGDVLVVNGTLRLMTGAAVSGDVLVVGGEIENSAAATIGGEIASYSPRYEGFGLAPSGREGAVAGSRFRGGRSDFLLTTGRSYNRVEGLPIAFGPRLETESSNPLRVEALGVYRTESGLSLDPDEMGYFVRADQYLGGRREYRVGAQLYSVVDPIEEWQLTDLETGLSTFLFHQDRRDHFERSGWALTAGWQPRALPVTLGLEGRWEKHHSRAAGAPWSLFRNSDPWRAQPLVAEGDIGSVIGQMTFDTRSDDWNPASGWLISARLENAFRVDLARPDVVHYEPGSPRPIPEAPGYGGFTTGFVDVRSYNRIDADARLNLRFVAGGSLTRDPLPPQRQHALGGEGSLPGYSIFSRDCGARSVAVVLPDDADTPGATPYYPNYGCDAFGLVQMEFRGKLDFRVRWDGGPWNDDGDRGSLVDRTTSGWDMAPDWAIFVDAGRGWSYHDDRPDEATHVDVGAGILLDRLGIYLAVPVTSGSGVNLFVRLGPRF
jgi:hypothetical protein